MNVRRNEIDLIDLIKQMTDTADPIMYQYYKGLENNTLIINGEIGYDTLEMYVLPLREWDNDPNVKEIRILVNCLGGEIINGMMLCETISKLKTKTTIEILGCAYSMGGFIAISGNSNPNVHTVCHEFSTALIHGGSTSLMGESNSIDDTVDFYRDFNEKMNNFMLENTKITKAKLNEMKRYQWFLDSKSMLEFGLVKEII